MGQPTDGYWTFVLQYMNTRREANLLALMKELLTTKWDVEGLRGEEPSAEWDLTHP